MIGHYIRLLRKSHGLDIQTLAARANVKPSALQAIEAGTKTELTMGELKRLARYFNLTPEDLAGLPTPGLENVAEWRELKEALYQHGETHGWRPVQEYLVVMKHAWGREMARLKQFGRKPA